MEDLCEHGTELVGTIQSMELLHYPNNCQLVK